MIWFAYTYLPYDYLQDFYMLHHVTCFRSACLSYVLTGMINPCLPSKMSVVPTPDSDTSFAYMPSHASYVDQYSIDHATFVFVSGLVILSSFMHKLPSLIDNVEPSCICICGSYFYYLLQPTRLLAQIEKFGLVHATSTFRLCPR